MSNPRHQTHTQTRDCVIRAHAAEMLARTNLAVEDFAETLYRACVQNFDSSVLAAKKVPDLDGLFAANDQSGYSKAVGRWNKRVERWLAEDGVEIPTWLEEPWVTALLPEWRERCLIELAGRYGLLAVRPVGMDGMGAMQVFGALMHRMGDVAGLGTKVFDDLVMDSDDGQWLPDLASSLDAMAAKCTTLSRIAKKVMAGEKEGA